MKSETNLDLNRMLDLAQTIGGICDCNCHFQIKLQAKLHSLNKPVGDYTLDEFAQLIEQCRQEFKQQEKAFDQWKTEQ